MARGPSARNASASSLLLFAFALGIRSNEITIAANAYVYFERFLRSLPLLLQLRAFVYVSFFSPPPRNALMSR